MHEEVRDAHEEPGACSMGERRAAPAGERGTISPPRRGTGDVARLIPATVSGTIYSSREEWDISSAGAGPESGGWHVVDAYLAPVIHTLDRPED